MINILFWFTYHWNLFPRVQLTNTPGIVQLMAWCRTGDKPLSCSIRHQYLSINHFCRNSEGNSENKGSFQNENAVLAVVRLYIPPIFAMKIAILKIWSLLWFPHIRTQGIGGFLSQRASILNTELGVSGFLASTSGWANTKTVGNLRRIKTHGTSL